MASIFLRTRAARRRSRRSALDSAAGFSSGDSSGSAGASGLGVGPAGAFSRASAAAAAAAAASVVGCASVLENHGSSPHATGSRPSSARPSLTVRLPFLTSMSKTFASLSRSLWTGLSKAKKSRGSTGRASWCVSPAAIRQQRGSIA